jgi:hypothetical protein
MHHQHVVSGTGKGVARKSLSRRLLMRLLTMRPDLTRSVLASRLCIQDSLLAEYECGQRLIPLDVQERLGELVLEEEQRLHRVARSLLLQVHAARRYEAGEVVSHLTSPPGLRWR